METKKTPIYKKIYNDYLNKIKTGVLKPGDRLPTEKEIQELYGVSRSPVRYSLDLLDNEGYIRRTPGRGTEVLHPNISPWAKLSGFTHYYNLHADKMTIKIISVETVLPDKEISDYFNCDANDHVLKITRIRFNEGKPIALINNFFAYAINEVLTESDYDNKSLLELMRKILNQEEVFVQEDISAVKATPRVSQLLKISEGDPVLFVTRHGMDHDNMPVEFTRYWALTDYMKYRTLFSANSKENKVDN